MCLTASLTQTPVHLHPVSQQRPLPSHAYLQETRQLQLDGQPPLELLLLLQLVLIRGGKHVGENAKQERQQKLQERDDL